MVEAMPYTVMQSLQDGLAPPGRRSYWKAGYLKGLGDDIIESVVAHAANVPSPFSLAEIVRWGGATARVGKDETAFGNREAPFLFNAVSMWEGAEGIVIGLTIPTSKALTMLVWVAPAGPLKAPVNAQL